MRRLSMLLTLSVGAAVQAQGGVASRVFIRGPVDSVVRLDSVVMGNRMPLIATLRKVDSLSRLQDGLTIGSPEYRKITEELRATIESTLPTGLSVFGSTDGTRIMLAPAPHPEVAQRMIALPQSVDVGPRGWLGFTADGIHSAWQDPDGSYVRYFVYPVIVTVEPNSPASKVGLQFGDSLLAYNGRDVRTNTFNLSQLIEPGVSLRLRLRRDGETKDVTLVPDRLPPDVERDRMAAAMAGVLVPSTAPRRNTVEITTRKAEENAVSDMAATVASRPGLSPARKAATVTAMGMGAVFGARIIDFDPAALIALTQQRATHGVFVSQVPTASLAARMGLGAGDVIVAVEDDDVSSVAQMLAQLRARGPNRVTQLTVLKAGSWKSKTLTYDPR